LTNVDVKEYIEERKAKQVEKSEITIDRIQQEYARIAFFDIRRIYNPDGTLIPIKYLDDDTAAAISSIESIQELYRGKTTGTTKKVKGFDKIRALEGLGKIFGAFKADNEQGAPVINNNLDLSHLSLEELKQLKYGKANP
jgi:phage terminase small subunit